MSHILDVMSQALYLRYNAYDNTVSVRSQALYRRYSACDNTISVRSLAARFTFSNITLQEVTSTKHKA